MVGLPRFELGTSCSQSRRANQAALQPVSRRGQTRTGDPCLPKAVRWPNCATRRKWTAGDSNAEPSPCEGVALPLELAAHESGACGIRTHDLFPAEEARFQAAPRPPFVSTPGPSVPSSKTGADGPGAEHYDLTVLVPSTSSRPGWPVSFMMLTLLKCQVLPCTFTPQGGAYRTGTRFRAQQAGFGDRHPPSGYPHMKLSRN
jgi:hypothetical protein